MAELDPASGVSPVSAAITRTRSSDTPVSSAATCAIMFSSPWPTSTAPLYTSSRLSSLKRTRAREASGKPSP